MLEKKSKNFGEFSKASLTNRLILHIVSNKAKERILKRLLQENKSRQIFQKKFAIFEHNFFFLLFL